MKAAFGNSDLVNDSCEQQRGEAKKKRRTGIGMQTIRTFSDFTLCVALHFLAFSTSLAFLVSSFFAAAAVCFFEGEEGGVDLVDFAGEVGGVEGSGEGVPATEAAGELISEATGCRDT